MDANTPNNDNNEEPMFEDLSAELEKAMNDENKAEQTLKAYKEALEQEWTEKNDPTNLRQTAKNVKEEIARHVQDYLVNMRGLAMGASSENIKYQANKWLLEAALLPGGAGAKDTLVELLEEMEVESKKTKTNSE